MIAWGEMARWTPSCDDEHDESIEEGNSGSQELDGW